MGERNGDAAGTPCWIDFSTSDLEGSSSVCPGPFGRHRRRGPGGRRHRGAGARLGPVDTPLGRVAQPADPAGASVAAFALP